MKVHSDKWAQDVDVEEGKMHKLLGIPEDQTIEENYTSGEKLAKDLLEATGDRSETSSMLAYPANVNPEDNVFDRALRALKNIEGGSNRNKIKIKANLVRDIIVTLSKEGRPDLADILLIP